MNSQKNNFMQVHQLIGELLLRNNCVVVPKFGGFVATQTPARIDAAKGLMLPPQKAVLFNKQLVNNDGLLVHAFAHAEKCSYGEAVSEIDLQVKSWQEELQAGKRLVFDKVGFLYLDHEKNVRFEQDRFFNLLLQSFGLGQVQFVAEEQIKQKESQFVAEKIPEISVQQAITPAVEKETPVISINFKARTEKTIPATVAKDKAPGKTNTRKLIRYVAAACVLPLAFYSFWIPMKTDVLESGIIASQDFNPFHQQTKQRYTKKPFSEKMDKYIPEKRLTEQIKGIPGDVEVYVLEMEDPDDKNSVDQFFIRIRETGENQTVTSEIQLPETNPLPVKTSSISRGNLHVIVGSFSNQTNAESLVNELKAKGFPATTFPEESGLIRVSAGGFSTDGEAQQVIQKLSEIQVSSWILKK